MGGARNLKLKGQWGQGQGTGGKIYQGAKYIMWAKCQPYLIVVCVEKM